MIAWQKIDNQPTTLNVIEGSQLSYNIIKEVPKRQELPGGLTALYFVTDKMPTQTTNKYIDIYIDGIIQPNITFSTLSTHIEGQTVDSGIVLTSIAEDSVIYCEYLPKDTSILFNDNVIINASNRVIIERNSITLHHDIINQIILYAKILEKSLFTNSEYNFNSFMIYTERENKSEISKMHITEMKKNIDVLSAVVDKVKDINITIFTNDPLAQQEDSETPNLYNIMREELLINLRTQLNNISNTSYSLITT